MVTNAASYVGLCHDDGIDKAGPVLVRFTETFNYSSFLMGNFILLHART